MAQNWRFDTSNKPLQACIPVCVQVDSYCQEVQQEKWLNRMQEYQYTFKKWQKKKPGI